MSEELNVDIIHLQHAHVTQYSGNKGCGNWLVRKNITNEDLMSLSSEYSEAQVFEILDFARKFELIAFNAGIQHGKGLNNDDFQFRFDYQKSVLEQLKAENERLANKLIQLISKEEN